jgi:hypothetical protein
VFDNRNFKWRLHSWLLSGIEDERPLVNEADL